MSHGMLHPVGASKIKRERAARQAAKRGREGVAGKASPSRVDRDETRRPQPTKPAPLPVVSERSRDATGRRGSALTRPTLLEIGIAALASISASALGTLWLGVLPSHPEVLRDNWASAAVTSPLIGGLAPILVWIGVAAGISARLSGHGTRALPILVASEFLVMLIGLVWYLAVNVGN